MRFRSNWDEYLICQLKKCPAVPSLSADSVVEMSEDSPRPRAVLTTYPPGYELPNGPGVNAETRGTVLVPWKFGQDGMLRQKGRLLRPGYRHNERSDSSAHSRNDNIPCLLYAGGFNFFHSSLLDECPYDHKLHGLFFGEEISMAVRLFTHGYELFAPPETVCYHLWSSRSRNRNDNDGSQRPKLALGRESSLEVVRMQLRGKGRGLGKVRSAEQFSRELGVDTEKHTLSQGCENIRLHCNTFVSPITAELDSGCTPDLLDAARPALKEECTNNDMTTVLKLVSQFMGHT